MLRRSCVSRAWRCRAQRAAPQQRLLDAPGLHWGWLGLGGALMNLVPLLWFLSTTLTGLAFIHTAQDAVHGKRKPPLIAS